MARFGRDVVRSLTRPDFAGGLFEVGEKIGGLPEQKMKEEETKGMMKEIADAQATGNTTALADIYERLGTSSGDPKYTLQASKLRNQDRLNTAQMSITQSISELSDPKLSDTNRAVLEEKAKAEAMALNDPQFLNSVLSSIQSSRSASRSNTLIAAKDAVSSGMSREDFIKAYGTEDAIRYDIAKSQALSARSAIRSAEDAKLEAEFSEQMISLSNQFDMAMARPSDAIDGDFAIQLQNQMIDLAEKAGKPVSEYVELFANRYEQKVADEIDAENQARLVEEAEGQRWADSTVSAVIRSGAADPIAMLAERMERVSDPKIQALYDKHLVYIKNGVEDNLQARQEIEESFETGAPSATAIDFLSDPANASYFEGLDSVENALVEFKKFNKKIENGGSLNPNERLARRTAVKLINSEVAKARGARRKQELSEPVAEINAEQSVDNYLNKLKGFKSFIGGQSVYDVVEQSRNKDGDLYKRVVSTLKREYMLQANIPAERQFEIIKQVVGEMGVETPGEEGFMLRERRLQEITDERRAMTRAWVKKTYTKNNKPPSESEINNLLKDQAVLDEAYEVIEEMFIERERVENEQREIAYRNMQNLRRTKAVRGN